MKVKAPIGGRLFEDEFEVIRALANISGLFLDVGANIGQSALVVLKNCRRWRVISLEPNRMHEERLEEIRRKYPNRYRYWTVGASSSTMSKRLYIPTSSYANLSENASCKCSEFKKQYVRRRIRLQIKASGGKGSFTLRSVPVKLVSIDSMGICPTVIKVDTEGSEREVFLGARETIKKCRPVIIVENNNKQRFVPLLKRYGYRLYRYAPDEHRLYAFKARTWKWTLNLVWLHSLCDKRVVRQLFELIDVPPKAWRIMLV